MSTLLMLVETLPMLSQRYIYVLRITFIVVTLYVLLSVYVAAQHKERTRSTGSSM